MWTRAILFFALGVSACAPARPEPAVPTPPAPLAPLHLVVPAPVTVEPIGTDTFVLAPQAIIVASGGAPAERIGQYLAAIIGNKRETTPRVLVAPDTTKSVIELAIDGTRSMPAEGYELVVRREGVRIVARTAAGLFYGVQTFRQLLPYQVEYTAALPAPMRVRALRITDAPRYEWRGAMLDVSRHFLPVGDVKSYIDLMALYKLNRLHLHLSDDQGWRIEIPEWPNLTAIGGSTQVGGGPGGFYTQEQFSDLARYAADRFITIVPEIDMPGHTNAALASYPELNCNDTAPPLYTGIQVGFSTLCADKEITYKFVDDVIRSISRVSPGPYFHIGGDEVKKLGREAYNRFVERVEGIVKANGKRMIGWSEIAPANVSGDAIVQSWIPDSAQLAVARGSKVILSPSKRVYIDMKYDDTTPIGLKWAALIDLRTAYDWEPSTYNPLLPAESILGLEAPLWAETLGKLADYQYMALPRLPAVAELAWSPASARGWEGFEARIRAHEPRWTALGWNYYRK
jgi:hexosaminidase